MRHFPARQVHLDFHTSQWIPDVGKKFDKAQFQAALKEGNVGSITIFAKCHHGYSYYPTKVGTQHPTMEPGFDLTGAIIDAAHEIGVAAPVYITAGWSALDADNHPEWIMKNKDGSMRLSAWGKEHAPEDDFPNCSWKYLCLNGEYADYIASVTQEVVDRYEHLDGLFFDICSMGPACYCDHCVAEMKKLGYDPDNEEDAKAYFVRQHLKFMQTNREILHKKFPEATIFFNGCAEIYAPEYHKMHTHLEMEDLPTCWGGYNKMPARASYMHRYGMEILGMTGKFHTVWGEFGGYKNPNALKYEALMMAMNGAKCSIGDQMPPNGVMDMETYRNIGVAFRALEEIEPYAYPAASTAEVGVYLSRDEAADQGLHTILLESQIDFGVVMEGDDLSAYKLLLLPDEVKLSPAEAERINAYIKAGGAVIFGYKSACADGKFLLDAGVEYLGEPKFTKEYLDAGNLDLPFGNAPFLCYEGAVQVASQTGEVLCERFEPYFNRTYQHYCSHMNTPYRDEPAQNPAMVQSGKVIYYAHPLCRMYYKDGAEVFKRVLQAAIRKLYTPKYEVKVPSAGRSRLTWQAHENRYIFHVSYASPIQRGYVSVIEDIVPLMQVPVAIRLEESVRQVNLVPAREAIPFTQENGVLKFTIPCVDCYQAVEIKL